MNWRISLLPLLVLTSGTKVLAQDPPKDIFARDNLVAWCIVPFDGKKRGPEERAVMMAKLGFKHFAYDWRAEHVPTFDAEMAALDKHGIHLEAFWFPAGLNKDALAILDVLRRHKIRSQLWVTLGDPAPNAKTKAEKIEAADRVIRPIAVEAAKIQCSVALYNHGGWFGEPENQLAIIDRLKVPNVGIVYNLHHGHDHLDRFPTMLKAMMPHLLGLNLNGMIKNGDRVGKKILPLGQGDLDLELLKTIRASGYRGKIGILGHTNDDAEARLKDNLDGLDWLVPQLKGERPGPKPKPRTMAGGGPAPSTGGWLAEGKAAYRTPPLTVELRAKLLTKDGYNILLASDTKQSSAHWEIFSMAGTGNLTVYLPGMQPDHVHTTQFLCDGKWHDVAMLNEPTRIRLFCDGKQVADQTVKSRSNTIVPGGLAFARLVEGTIGCNGELDYVHLSRGIRSPEDLHAKPLEPRDDTIGLWQFKPGQKSVEDHSKQKNPAKLTSAAPVPSSAPPPGNQLFPADPRLKAVLIDRSENDAYCAVRVDSMGRVFVGGREAVFVFEPNDKGGYQPKQELVRFPPNSIIMGLEILGDDLYVLAANALYVIPAGRVLRKNLQPKRLLWGLPLDLHVSFHCLAWGPEGDLYLNHGDPLLNYGQWDRPDHWGHWTLFPSRDGLKIPYTGAGSVLRLRPFPGASPRVVAGGLRGPVGLTFDSQWNLFTNDNDHESKADLYAPARLMHVTPHADFAWPRGWLASKSLERSDLLDLMTSSLGRGVPCDMTYYDEPYLPETYRRQLFMCRWDRMAVTRYPLTPRGASFTTEELDFAQGKNLARPVGIAVGRGGRVFVTSLYLAGNVVSPHCVSDLVMITRADDAADHPFQPYDVNRVSTDWLWKDLSSPSLERRGRAHQEILRRGGALLDEADRRLASIDEKDPAVYHLPWLAAAGPGGDGTRRLHDWAKHPRPELRQLAIRVLAEFPRKEFDRHLLVAALEDTDPRVQLAALPYFFSSPSPPPLSHISRLARSKDTYVRQTAATLLARRYPVEDIAQLLFSNPSERLAAVLALGIRLTVPPPHDDPPKSLPLFYPAGNAFFHTKLRFADADGEIDLRDFGRVGSYTMAERWKTIAPTADQKECFRLLKLSLEDPSPAVQNQAAYYLSLLRDPRSEPLLVKARHAARVKPLLPVAARPIPQAWVVGPFVDSPTGIAHPPEQGVIELSAVYPSGDKSKLQWQQATSDKGRFAFPKATDYVFFRLQSASRQAALLEIHTAANIKVWHNGQAIESFGAADAREVLLDLQPGSNDILLRCQIRTSDPPGVAIQYRAARPVSPTLPEKVDGSLLAQRLKEGNGQEKVAPEFLNVDWSSEVLKGDIVQGRRLFGTLGCVKCHAITADQKANGGPSLTDARKRFTVPYLVESILLPSKQVAEPFRATNLVTKNGLSLTGLVVNESADHLELLLPDATRRLVPRSEIEERAVSALSPMPAALVKTRAELRDLLAYVLSANPSPP